MGQHHFRVKTDAWPLVASTDEVLLVHRDALAIPATLYIGAHEDTVIEVRSAGNRTAVETATGPHVGDPSTGGSGIFIPGGGKVRIDVPGSGFSPLDLVTKINTLKGRAFVHISSIGVFDTHLKQIDSGI